MELVIATTTKNPKKQTYAEIIFIIVCNNWNHDHKWLCGAAYAVHRHGKCSFPPGYFKLDCQIKNEIKYIWRMELNHFERLSRLLATFMMTIVLFVAILRRSNWLFWFIQIHLSVCVEHNIWRFQLIKILYRFNCEETDDKKKQRRKKISNNSANLP